MRVKLTSAALCVLLSSSAAFASLTDNLLNGGHFETTSYLKNTPSLDDNSVEIPVHRFNQDADLGLWIGQHGPPSICSGGYCGLAGFGLYDDPRDLSLSSNPLATYNTRDEADLGTMNRSVDPFNASNHVMENALFRIWWGQWFEAPARHKTGPIQFDFDFYLQRWDLDEFGESRTGAETVIQVVLYGMNELPPHDVAYVGPDPPALEPLDAGLSGARLLRYNYGDWWDTGDSGGWQSISTTNPGFMWDERPTAEGGKQDIFADSVSQTYPYYALVFRTRTWDENHEYWWVYDERVSDTFAVAVDDVSLQLSVQVRSDFDDDGLVNLLDINPFVIALTNPTLYDATYPDVDKVLVDPNEDGTINLIDIPAFVGDLTGSGETAAPIPEPAALALLVLAVLGLLRPRVGWSRFRC